MRFIAALSEEEVASVIDAMREVALDGLVRSRHLRGDVYEVRADAPTRSFRILFAAEGHFGQILLALSAFEKRTQRTPPREIALAEERLRDWRRRGR